MCLVSSTRLARLHLGFFNYKKMVYYTLRCDHGQYQVMVLYTIRAVKMGLDLEFELIGMVFQWSSLTCWLFCSPSFLSSRSVLILQQSHDTELVLQRIPLIWAIGSTVLSWGLMLCTSGSHFFIYSPSFPPRASQERNRLWYTEYDFCFFW